MIAGSIFMMHALISECGMIFFGFNKLWSMQRKKSVVAVCDQFELKMEQVQEVARLMMMTFLALTTCTSSTQKCMLWLSAQTNYALSGSDFTSTMY